jgi:AcrR family transcriptional regulator
MDQQPTKRYSSHLRQTQVELTQRTIMEAMAAVLVELGAEGDAVKQVARRANVSERTIYRHYPSKDLLWDAFLDWVSERVGLGKYPDNMEEMIELIPELFERFDKEAELLKACLNAAAWSDIWLKGRKGWMDGAKQCITNSVGKLEPKRLHEAAAIVHLLFNGISWKTFADQWGMQGVESAPAVQWALQSLLVSLKLTQGPEVVSPRRKAKAPAVVTNTGTSLVPSGKPVKKN